MASPGDLVPAAAVQPSRRIRRRWFWLVIAGTLLLAGGLGVREGWGAWQERSARQALDEDHLEQAHVFIDQALRVRSGRSSTNLLAARIARLRGAYAEAAQHLGRCGEHNGMSESLHLEWLLLRCQRGEIDELAGRLTVLANNDRDKLPAIMEALASVYMRQTRYLEAFLCLNRWVESAPDSVRALDWHGWVSIQLGHRSDAIDDFERILTLQPDRSAVRLRLAEILIEDTRHAEAEPHLERLREELPDNPDVMVALARCRRVQSRMDESRALLDEVLRAHPNHFDALVQMGKIELDSRHFAEAEQRLRKALERSPGDPEARYDLYQSLRGQPGRQREAQQEFDRWNQDKQARDRLTRLLRTELGSQPNNPDLAREAGELLLKQGEEQRGLFWLYKALSLNPRHVATLRILVSYYDRKKNNEKAAEYRQRLASLGVVP